MMWLLYVLYSHFFTSCYCHQINLFDLWSYGRYLMQVEKVNALNMHTNVVVDLGSSSCCRSAQV